MKKRIKIDSAILSFIIILTAFLYQFNDLYPTSESTDNVMDFLGMLFVLKGTFIRMIARSYKKDKSDQGNSLVIGGIYTLTRNPMYLGSFYIGSGFVFIVWPWWTIVLFSGLFYARFRGTILKEEANLKQLFGDEYENYCHRVPRVFPTLDSIRRTKIKEIINLNEMFATKEARGLAWLPLLAVVLETFQEKIIFYKVDIVQTILIFALAAVIFLLISWVEYKTRN